MGDIPDDDHILAPLRLRPMVDIQAKPADTIRDGQWFMRDGPGFESDILIVLSNAPPLLRTAQ